MRVWPAGIMTSIITPGDAEHGYGQWVAWVTLVTDKPPVRITQPRLARTACTSLHCHPGLVFCTDIQNYARVTLTSEHVSQPRHMLYTPSLHTPDDVTFWI